MEHLNKKNEDEHKDAITYIKNSSIFTNKRYKWILPLITRVLQNNLEESDINNLINSLLPRKTKENTKGTNKQKQDQDPKTRIPKLDHKLTIKKVISIDKISNIGLLDISKSFKLKEGLNIFFGKNASGKSSIYLSLCKVFGKEKKIYSNVLKEDKISSCEVTCEGNDGKSFGLKWNSNKDNQELKVMIFDNSISNFLVEQNQVNKFKMAHLKMEYFSFLYSLCQQVEKKIRLELTNLNSSLDNNKALLLEKVPFFFDINLNKKDIKDINFSKGDEKKFKELEKRIKILEKNNPEATLKNIRNVIEEIENILPTFGEKREKSSKEGKVELIWMLYYTESYFNEVNKRIKECNEIKNAFEKSGKDKISSIIPPDWINKEKWKVFISSSIDFLNSLNKVQSNKYFNELCAYCHQPLETKESKILMKAYQELYEEHKEKLDKILIDLKEISKSLETCINELDQITQKNKKIEAEFENINKEGEIEFDFIDLKKIFQSYMNFIDKTKIFNVNQSDLKKIQAFWDIYKGLLDEFGGEFKKLSEAVSNRKSEIDNLYEKFKPLKRKKDLFMNKNTILGYFKIQESIDTLNCRSVDISSLRTAISSLETKFSQKSTLEEFKKYLDDEYKYFNFSPPKIWNIKISTGGGVNKRIYSIGDKKLAEIFSEGEKKLHALSDFFAQCKLDKYKGIFIFDDPISSLDEDNIEAVANRILELAKSGNQVIIFTHNLVFLNSIIETQKDKVNKVSCLSNQIILEPNMAIGTEAEMKSKLKEIDKRISEFSKLPKNEIPEYGLRNVYDLISGYIENYVEICYLKGIITRYKPNIRMNKLVELKDLNLDYIDKITKLYCKTSRKGSRHSQPVGVQKPTYEGLVDDIDDLKRNFKYK